MQRGPVVMVAALLIKPMVGIGSAAGLGLLKKAGQAATGDELMMLLEAREEMVFTLARCGAGIGEVLGASASRSTDELDLRPLALAAALALEERPDVGLPQDWCFLQLVRTCGRKRQNDGAKWSRIRWIAVGRCPPPHNRQLQPEAPPARPTTGA